MDILKLNGVEYPFHYAVKAQSEMGKVDMSKKDDIYLIWLGLKYGAIKEKKKFVLTEENLLDIFEDDMDALGKACQLLATDLGKLKKMKEVLMPAL